MRHLFTFSSANKRRLLLLIGGCLLWSLAAWSLWLAADRLVPVTAWWSAGFIFFQLYGAVQVSVAALVLNPEPRRRGFYLFWLLVLAGLVWSTRLVPDQGPAATWAAALQTGVLLFAGTLIGVTLARYVKRLWEVLPLCLVMMLADFSSWAVGPTAEFARDIEKYYLEPVGPPPWIDMVLVKFAYPGASGMVPVFGVSDWIVVVFFAAVAKSHRLNDNLLQPVGPPPDSGPCVGCYLPVSAAALFLAIMLAHGSGLFIPALPLMVVVVIGYFPVRRLLCRAG